MTTTTPQPNPADLADFRLILTMRAHPSREDARWQELHAEYVERFGSSWAESDADHVTTDFRLLTDDDLESGKAATEIWKRQTAEKHGVDVTTKEGRLGAWHKIPMRKITKREMEDEGVWVADVFHDYLLVTGSRRVEKIDLSALLERSFRVELTDGAFKHVIREGQREGWLAVTEKTSWNGRLVGHTYAHRAANWARANAEAAKRETSIEQAKSRLEQLVGELSDPQLPASEVARMILRLNSQTDGDELEKAIERHRDEHASEQEEVDVFTDLPEALVPSDQSKGQWWDDFEELNQTWANQHAAREAAEKLIDRIVGDGAPKYLPGHYVAHLVAIGGRWEIRLQRFDRTQGSTLNWSVQDARDSLKRQLPDTRIVLASYGLVTAPNVAKKMRHDRIDSATRPKS